MASTHKLIAEMGAAFLGAYCGLQGRLEHASSYTDYWLNTLRRDKRPIFVAAGAAQKAVDSVVGSQAVVAVMPSPMVALTA